MDSNEIKPVDTSSPIATNKPSNSSHSSPTIIPHDPLHIPTEVRTSDDTSDTNHMRAFPINLTSADGHALMFESFLNDISYIKHQNKYLNEYNDVTHITNDTSSYDRECFIQLLNDKFNIELTHQLISSFFMTSLVYFAIDHSINDIDSDGIQMKSNCIVKLSPDNNNRQFVQPMINEWYILSGLNVNTKHNVSHPLLNMSNKPATLPLGLPGILYPERVINLDINHHKRFAMIYENSGDYVTLKQFYDPGIGNTTSNSALGHGVGTGLNADSLGSSHSVHSNTSFNSNRHNSFSNNLAFESGHNGSSNSSMRQFSRTPVEIISIINDIIKVVEIVSTIHDYGFVQNSLTSINIIKSTKNPSDIKIGGFEFSFNVQPEAVSNDIRSPYLSELIEYLPYMSPESLSRSQGSTYRSDFYSIGVILYELLVGRLPFSNENSSKLIRMHVTHKPISPVTIGSSWIIQDLNDVIMKLLAKNPWMRYSNGKLLINDLVYIKNQYINDLTKLNYNHLPIEYSNYDLKNLLVKSNFVDSSQFIPIKLSPKKVYGRSEEYIKVFDQFNSTVNGTNVLIIHGQPGSGKTTLLHDIEERALSKQEFYFYYKYNMFAGTGGIYHSFICGIRCILRQILSSNIETIEKWRHHIISNIPIDLSILQSLMPEFEILIGPKYSTIINQPRDNSNSSWTQGNPKNSQGTKLSKEEPSLSSDNGSITYSESRSPNMNNETFNLELRIRYLIKSLIGLFAIHGLTLLMDDIHFVTPSEWRMFAEILDYLSSSEIQNNHSFKLFATFDDSKHLAYSFDEMKYLLKSFTPNVDTLYLGPINYESFMELWKATVINKDDSIRHRRHNSHFKTPPTSLSSMNLTKDPLESSSFDSESIVGSTSPSLPANRNHSSESHNLGMYKLPYTDEEILNTGSKLYDMTNGNILIWKYIVRFLYLRGEMSYQKSRGAIEGSWKFNINRLEKYFSPSSSAQSQTLSVLSRPIKTVINDLPIDCKQLLRLVCIIPNDDFNLYELTILSELPLEKVFEILTICIIYGVVTPTSASYKFPFHLTSKSNSSRNGGKFPFDLTDGSITDFAKETTFCFFHDSVRQSLFDDLKEIGELSKVNNKVAMCSYKELKKSNSISNEAEISKYLLMGKHFNESIDVPNSQREYEIYFEVLVQAGKYALGTYNMEDSLVFFNNAYKFVDKVDVHSKLKVLLTICQLYYILDDYEKCVDLINKTEVEFKFSDLVFLTTKINCLVHLKRYEETLKVAIRGLKLLNIEISENKQECIKISTFYKNHLPLTISEIRDLKTVSFTNNEKIKHAFEIISDLVAPTYNGNDYYIKEALAYQAVALMYKHGTSSHCAVPLMYISNNLAKSGDKSKFLRAIEYVKVAMNLLERDETLSYSYIQSVYELYLTTIACYMEPMSLLLKYQEIFLSSTRSFFRAGSNSRDMIMGLSRISLLYLNGGNFHEMKRVLHKQDHEYYTLITKDFRDLQLNGTKLLNEEIDLKAFESLLNTQIQSLDYIFAFNYYKICYLISLQKFDELLSVAINNVEPIDKYIPNTLIHINYYMAMAVSLGNCHSGNITDDTRNELIAKILRYFDLWDDMCPSNFHAKNLLIKAVLDVNDEIPPLDKLELFEDAIEYAKKFHNWNDVAWGNELCANWLIKMNKYSKKIQYFSKNAIFYFKKLGFDITYKFLTKKYANYLKDYNWAGIDDIEIQNADINNNMNERTNYDEIGLEKESLERKISMTNINLKNNLKLNTLTGNKSPNPINKILSSFFSFNSSSSATDKILSEPLKSFPGPALTMDLEKSNKLNQYNDIGTLRRMDNKKNESSKPTEVFDKIPETTENVDLNQAVKSCLDISNAPTEELILVRLLQSTIRFSEVDYGVVVMQQDNEPFIQAIGSPNNIYNLYNEPLSSRTDLCPFTLISHVLQTGEILNQDEDNLLFQNRFCNDDYYQNNNCLSMICIPLKTNEGKTSGALYLENQRRKSISIGNNVEDKFRPVLNNNNRQFFNAKKKDLIKLLCSQASVSLAKIELYAQMDHAKRIAEDATAEKASFLANMSHEIRTPFNSLLSCSIFLLDTELNKTQREYVETIRNSAMITLNIIDGILAFSKIEHGSFTLSNEPFSLIESIENAIQLVGEQAVINNLELVFFNKCPNIKSIFGDETRFRQIIINLVGNAVKFTNEGHIIVEVSSKPIVNNRYEITVSVEDTGIGIPKYSTNKVFGAFSQVNSSSRRVYGGSGLGLAISKKLADLMGGTLTFDSVEGEGSTFYFIVNAEVELMEEPEIKYIESHKEDSTIESINILEGKGDRKKVSTIIVDNHELTRLSLQENLRWYGLNVDIVNDVSLLTDKIMNNLNSVFIHYDQFNLFLSKFNKPYLNQLGIKIILISQFGKSIPKEIDDETILSVLLVPFQKPKIIELIRNLNNLNVNHELNNKSNTLKAIELSSPDTKIDKTFAERYPLKILLAEDNLINLRVALQHLKKLGYEADHAKDGVEVIDKCLNKLKNQQHYDVIFMDIQMPRKDGIATTIELKELFNNDNKQSFLPEIVALTANVAGEDRQRSLDCGMIDFVPKPILPNNLMNVLKKIGERRLDVY